MAVIPKEAQPPLAALPAAGADDRRARLGYAYLRLLASEAGFGCAWVGSHSDGRGLDVRFDVHERLDEQALLGEFSLEVMLRAAPQGLPLIEQKLIFSLDAARYELLRGASAEQPRFMVLLTLPADLESRPELAAEDLVSRRSGRWLCLSGAPQGAPAATVPVKFPTWNVLTPLALREIARRVALGLRFFHEQ